MWRLMKQALYIGGKKLTHKPVLHYVFGEMARLSPFMLRTKTYRKFQYATYFNIFSMSYKR